MGRFFNYSHQVAESAWDRSSFVQRWRRIFHGDRVWAPPYAPLFRRSLDPRRNPYLRSRPHFLLSTTAVTRRSSPQVAAESMLFSGVMQGGFATEEPVAACAATQDPSASRVMRLGLLHLANDEETLERLLYHLAEDMEDLGCDRLIGPTGLSPHLGSGLLVSDWDQVPPLHAAYHPPYMADLVATLMEPLSDALIYSLPSDMEIPALALPEVRISPFDASRLAGDLLPLLQAACPEQGWFPHPDTTETRFLLDWMQVWPVHSLLASANGEPVGLALLQPDLATRLQRYHGGGSLTQRILLRWSVAAVPAEYGRLVFAGVLPAWRRQGIGRLLLVESLHIARRQGWRTLRFGPLPEGSPGSRFLESVQAQEQWRYRLFQWSP